MKKTLLILSLSAAVTARAQWLTTNYALKGGWNAISLTGEISYGDLEVVLPAAVEEVWRWNPNPGQAQFTESPLIPSPGTPDWSVWRRANPGASTLTRMTGPAAYLVKCTGPATTTHSVALKQSVRAPQNTWLRSGANLLGFPAAAAGGGPFFTQYFATFPVATAANTRIFKYTGGDLGPANPLQVFSPSLERLDRTKAYWFSAEVVGNFYAPIELNFTAADGLGFGRGGNSATLRVRNRTAAPVTLTFTPQTSEAAPAGQPAVTAAVPLTRRIFNSTTLLWDTVPLTSAFTQVIGPQAEAELRFGIDRAHPSMSGAAADAFFASLLRVTDSSNLLDIHLPVSASKTSLAGLWVGDVTLKRAGHADAAPGDTPREFSLRMIVHVPDSGPARLLSSVFIGQLAAPQNPVGVCTAESLLKADAKASAQRIVAAHMPLDQVITAGSGSVAIGSTLTRTVQVPFNDPTNPFVHQYHPDHDNKDPRGNALPAGRESFSITRTCSFTFTASPPAGSAAESGWGSSVIGGDYSETIAGLHRRGLSIAGTFILRRVTESGTLHTP